MSGSLCQRLDSVALSFGRKKPEGKLAGVSRWRDEHRGVVMRDGKVQAGGLADKGQKRQAN